MRPESEKEAASLVDRVFLADKQLGLKTAMIDTDLLRRVIATKIDELKDGKDKIEALEMELTIIANEY